MPFSRWFEKLKLVFVCCLFSFCCQISPRKAFELYQKAQLLAEEGDCNGAAELFRRAFKESSALKAIYKMWNASALDMWNATKHVFYVEQEYVVDGWMVGWLDSFFFQRTRFSRQDIEPINHLFDQKSESEFDLKTK